MAWGWVSVRSISPLREEQAGVCWCRVGILGRTTGNTDLTLHMTVFWDSCSFFPFFFHPSLSLTPSFSCCPPSLEYWNLEKEIGSVLCAATLVSWNLELVSLTLVAYLQGKSFLFFFVCRSLPIKIIFCSCLCFSRVWNLVCFTTVSSLLFLIEVLVH